VSAKKNDAEMTDQTPARGEKAPGTYDENASLHHRNTNKKEKQKEGASKGKELNEKH